MLDVQIAGTNAAQRHPYDGIMSIDERWLRLLGKTKLTFINIGISLHAASLLFLIELSKHLHAILMVGHATRLATTVHSEYGITHVDTSQRDGRSQDIA